MSDLGGFLSGLSLPTQPLTPCVMSELEEGLALRRARGRKFITDLGLKVGDKVTVSWEFDNPSGGSTMTAHTGTIAELNDWITIDPASTSNGVLHLPISALTSVMRIDKKES